jgi:hypothetical protein
MRPPAAILTTRGWITPAHLTWCFLAVAISAPLFWWALDRSPPYARDSGRITPADPNECGLGSDAPQGALFPDSCAHIEWTITPIRTCLPAGRYSVTRWVRGANDGMWPLPSVGSILTAKTLPNSFSRSFVIPHNMPSGQAIYGSSACFACNPLQHLIFPICIDKPEISFEVVRP